MPIQALIERITQSNIDDYRKIITQLGVSKFPKIYANGNADNANIVAANIFKNATTLRIFSDDMNGDIGDRLPDYFEGLKIFLSKNDSKLTIVLENPTNPKKSQALSHLIEIKTQPAFANRIKTYKASADFIDGVKSISAETDKYSYFIAGDSAMFRLQYDHNVKSAYFSFNFPEVTSQLISIFDNNLKTCTEF